MQGAHQKQGPPLWEKALRLLENTLGVAFDERLRRAYKALFMKYEIYEKIPFTLTDDLLSYRDKYPDIDFDEVDETFNILESVSFGDEVLFEGLMLAGATPTSFCSDLGINPNNYSESYPDDWGIGHLSGKVIDIIESAETKNGILTPQAFLGSLFQNAVGSYGSPERPFTVTTLNILFEGLKEPYVRDDDSTYRILETLLKKTAKHPTVQDEQCFLMFLGKEKVRVRPISFMGTHNLRRSESGLYLPVNAHLTHFLDRFGFLTVEEIEELEFLINNPKVNELKLQAFFEAHPNFLLGTQSKSLRSQVILTREDQGPLIPDFMIEGPPGEINKIIDLKRPNQKFVRRKKNRLGFLQSFIEARDQLYEYRDYFEDRTNRRMFEQNTGLRAYRPKICVIIGRNKEYSDFYQRQTLMSREPDIEIVTYDDILQAAKEKQIVFEESWRDIKDIQ